MCYVGAAIFPMSQRRNLKLQEVERLAQLFTELSCMTPGAPSLGPSAQIPDTLCLRRMLLTEPPWGT